MTRRPRPEHFPASQWARVIINPADARKDIFMLRTQAVSQYRSGHLAIDLTNTTPEEIVYARIGQVIEVKS